MQLPGAIEQGRTPAVSQEINFDLLMSPDAHDIFDNSRSRPACDARDLQPMVLQMHRQDLVTGVADFQPVAPAMLHTQQRPRIGCREARAVDGPAVEAAARGFVSGQYQRECFVGRSRCSSRWVRSTRSSAAARSSVVESSEGRNLLSEGEFRRPSDSGGFDPQRTNSARRSGRFPLPRG